MIHNAGNENDNPRSQSVISGFEDDVKRLCLHQVKANVDEDKVDYIDAFLQAMVLSYTKPILTSMLTDTNQADQSRLSSRTDDLHAVLTIPSPSR